MLDVPTVWSIMPTYKDTLLELPSHHSHCVLLLSSTSNGACSTLTNTHSYSNKPTLFLFFFQLSAFYIYLRPILLPTYLSYLLFLAPTATHHYIPLHFTFTIFFFHVSSIFFSYFTFLSGIKFIRKNLVIRLVIHDSFLFLPPVSSGASAKHTFFFLKKLVNL